MAASLCRRAQAGVSLCCVGESESWETKDESECSRGNPERFDIGSGP